MSEQGRIRFTQRTKRIVELLCRADLEKAVFSLRCLNLQDALDHVANASGAIELYCDGYNESSPSSKPVVFDQILQLRRFGKLLERYVKDMEDKTITFAMYYLIDLRLTYTVE